MNLNIKIAGRTAVDAMLALAREPDTIPLVNAGRNFYGQCFMLLNATGSMTTAARFCDKTARTVALWTGLLNREKSLL